MEIAQLILETISQIVFVALAVAAVAHWRRRRDEGSAWLAMTFGILGFIVIIGRVLPQDEDPTGWLFWATKVIIAMLVLFPYCLYRFTASFGRPTRTNWALAHLITSVVVVWTFFLPRFPRPGEPRTGQFAVFLIVFLAQWTALSGWTAWRLWTSGRRQPSVARRRMQTLAWGSLLMNGALLVAGASPAPADEVTTTQLITQILSLTSAPLFYLGFAPPNFLRTAWRRPEEIALRTSEAELMAAMTPEGVADALLPHIAGIFGGRGAILTDSQGRVSASHGFGRAEAQRIVSSLGPQDTAGEAREVRAGVLYQPMRRAGLAVMASPYTPFFGRDEIDLLREISLFADLALERTELVAAERQAREAVEAANAELEGFVYSASHDLKNPLVTLLGYLEFLKADYADRLGDEGRHYVDRMSVSAAYMQALINDLLELSRIGRLQTEAEPVEFNDIVSEVAEDLRKAHPDASIDIAQLPVVRMNRLRARQLVTNLLDNALKHGGRPDLRITVTGETVDDRARLVFADNGQGVPPAYREKVFGVFERLEGTSLDGNRGTGIGLAVCRKIVEGLGGRIWIGDTDTGTEICIDVPSGVMARERTMV